MVGGRSSHPQFELGNKQNQVSLTESAECFPQLGKAGPIDIPTIRRPQYASLLEPGLDLGLGRLQPANLLAFV